ncbi:MAG: type I 3-dehydroquinate dehydratase [Crenarchaeota archaeon]|nr:type I 3-dehydroquinate dehydratase [Thermoproteota archaeon]
MYAVGSIPFTDPREVQNLIIKAAAAGADFVELRLDYWKEQTPPPLKGASELARGYGMGVIVTVRHPKEGGVWLPPWRDDAYRAADELGLVCDSELKFTDEVPCRKTILSVHYFDDQPELGEVRRMSEEALNKGAWVFKIATVAKDELSYFAIMKESAHPRTAFMPLGEGTERLRLASALLGSFLNYGSVGEPTAPGQVRLSELARVLSPLSC